MGTYYPGDLPRSFESSIDAIGKFQPYESLLNHSQSSAAVELSIGSMRMQALEGGKGVVLGLIEIIAGTLPVAKGAGAIAKNLFIRNRINDFAGSLIHDHLIKPIIDRTSGHRIAKGYKLEQNEPPYMFANLGVSIGRERGKIAVINVDGGIDENRQLKLQLVSANPQNERGLMSNALKLTRAARMHARRFEGHWNFISSFTPLPGAEPIIAVTNAATGTMLELIPNYDTGGTDAGIDEFIGRLAVEIVVLRQKMLQSGVIGVPIDISLLALPASYRKNAQDGRVSYTKFMMALRAFCDVVNYQTDDEFAHFVVDHFSKR